MAEIDEEEFSDVKMYMRCTLVAHDGMLQSQVNNEYFKQVVGRKQFIEEVDCFFQDVNIEELMGQNCISVRNLRAQMERQRGEPLIFAQKKLLMEIVTDKFAEFKAKLVAQGKENSFKRKSSVGSPVTPAAGTSNHSKEEEVECGSCGKRVPSTIFPIHKGICKNVHKNQKSATNYLLS